jgi:hypothetical protein
MALIKLNNNAVKNATAFGDITGLGNMVLLATQTASADASLSFTSGINSTYKEYVFIYNNFHPASDNEKLTFQASIDSGSNYNVALTSTRFYALGGEDGSTTFEYDGAEDQAQGTAFQNVNAATGNGNDESSSGILRIFEPSSTTFVKHFMITTESYHGADLALNAYTAGYFNTTSAIDEIQFKVNTGNIESGDICLYGIA